MSAILCKRSRANVILYLIGLISNQEQRRESSDGPNILSDVSALSQVYVKQDKLKASDRNKHRAKLPICLLYINIISYRSICEDRFNVSTTSRYPGPCYAYIHVLLMIQYTQRRMYIAVVICEMA